MGTETIYNETFVRIFDPKIRPSNSRNGFSGFQGYNCNVKFLLGETQLDCYDHKISCYLIHSTVSEVYLIVEPIDPVTEWYVEIKWSDKPFPISPIVDETLEEIITYPKYGFAHIEIPKDTTKIREKNNIRKIIKELSSKHFLEDITDEPTVIKILEDCYSNMKLY